MTVTEWIQAHRRSILFLMAVMAVGRAGQQFQPAGGPFPPDQLSPDRSEPGRRRSSRRADGH